MGQLGELLRRERKSRHEMQWQTSERFGISQPAYFRWEAGQNFPAPERFESVADFLRVPVHVVVALVTSDRRP